jgi:hypothetical protein
MGTERGSETAPLRRAITRMVPPSSFKFVVLTAKVSVGKTSWVLQADSNKLQAKSNNGRAGADIHFIGNDLKRY